MAKNALRVMAYGEVDELNSFLGLALAHGSHGPGGLDENLHSLLTGIQSELFDVGAELASLPAKQASASLPLISDAQVSRLEQAIDAYEAELPPLSNFVLPGGSIAGGHLHVARTVCRRAERSLVTLMEREAVRETVLVYLNRLSDLLFVLARYANQRDGVVDIPWQGRSGRT